MKSWKEEAMRILIAALAATLSSLWTSYALAWWDEGHMQIALMAYNKLTDTARVRVDELVKLNPDYDDWIVGVLGSDLGRIAFMRASVWADDIKMKSNYLDDGNSGNVAGGSDNFGYSDLRKHKYWHFMDIGFSTDGTQIAPPDNANALTQILTFSNTLPSSSGASDGVRSYDLVWLIHLVGDVHQPLHATARFSVLHNMGDQGGNLATVIKATGEQTKLHAYWDGVFGGYTTPKGATLDLRESKLEEMPVDEATAAVKDPLIWLQESSMLAQKFAYAEPVLSASGAAELSRAYETAARDTARTRAALASTRLANLINSAFP
jgi:S1/P1 Nuclease